MRALATVHFRYTEQRLDVSDFILILGEDGRWRGQPDTLRETLELRYSFQAMPPRPSWGQPGAYQAEQARLYLQRFGMVHVVLADAEPAPPDRIY